jgi:hypothetical protein
MTWLTPIPEHIPDELQALGWLLWRAKPVAPTEKNPSPKAHKVPHQIAFPGRRASSTDPATWGTFRDAVEAFASLVELPAHPVDGPIVGLGCVLTREAWITCIDLDDVLDGETLDPDAARIVARCSSWTERSPSNKGLHIWVRGQMPRDFRRPQIEAYSTARYIAITGHQWPGTPPKLTERQSYLTALAGLDAPLPSRRVLNTPPPDDLAGALLARLQEWGVPYRGLKRWADGFLVELLACPWSEEHTTGHEGAAVMIRASGAFNFSCRHAHCSRRDWYAFRAVTERRG